MWIFGKNKKLAAQNVELETRCEMLQNMVTELTGEVNSLTTKNKNLNRVNTALKKQVKNLTDLNAELQGKLDAYVVADNEFKAADNEFTPADNEFNSDVEKRDFEGEAKLLAKELEFCWVKRQKHARDKNGAFSGIEWAGVSNNVLAGLNSYTKDEPEDAVDKTNVEWMLNMFKEFDGKL
jgi:hypothetical protein